MSSTTIISATSRTTSSSSSKTNKNNKKTTFISVHPFHGDIKKNQLTFPSNSKIIVVSEKESAGQQEDISASCWGWGKCIDTNQVGWFPKSYVKPLTSSSSAARGRKTATNNRSSKVSCSSMATPTTTTNLDDSNDDDNVIMGGVSTAKAGTGVRMMTSAYLNDDKLKNDDGNNESDSNDSEDDDEAMKGKRSNKLKTSLKKLKSRFPSKKKKNSTNKTEHQETKRPPFLFNRKVQEEDPFKPVIRIIDTPTTNNTTSSSKAA